MGLSIDGLSSGLDTTSLINSLMTIEAAPQSLIKSKAATVQTSIAAFQGLNSAVADLAAKASKLADPKALEQYSASSTASNVKASIGAGAKPGAVDFSVTRLSQSQVSVTQDLAAWPYTTMTVTDKAGNAVTVTPLSTSLDDVVSAVNLSGAGIVASKVSVGGGAYRLQFAAAKSGDAGSFTIADPDGTVGLKPVQDAQDAQIKLWAGSTSEVTVSSSTNTFAELLPGVSVTVSDVSTSPARVTIARDNAQISKSASDLVSSVNGVLAQISTKSTVVSSTDAAGAPVTSGGVFTGDSTVRTVNAAILSAATLPVNGKSPSDLGIVLNKTGSIDFDATKFGDAMTKDPVGTMAAVSTIAARVADAAKQASDPTSGLLTTKIKGKQSDVKDYTDQIASWDDRLAMRRATLQQTYSALEVALSGMKAQSAWLSSQISGLSSGSSQ